ncbi:hypothetical protein [Calothrix sp. NIES-2100]
MLMKFDAIAKCWVMRFPTSVKFNLATNMQDYGQQSIEARFELFSTIV